MRPLFLFLAAVLVPVVLVLVVRLVLYPPIQGQPEIAFVGDPSMPGHRGTDSVADIMARSSARFPVVAMGFVRTSDGRFVCGRDWSAFGGSIPSLDTVLANRNARYAPCVLEEVTVFFQIHPRANFYIATKDDPVAAAKQVLAQLGDRLIVEVRDTHTACLLHEAGARRIVYSVDAASGFWFFNELRDPCVAEIEAVSVSRDLVLTGHALMARAVTGKPIWVESADSCLGNWLLSWLGADGYFTDRDKPGRCRKLLGVL
ncbi:hypothetical protein [Mesorhizobium sp. 10J20-29]